MITFYTRIRQSAYALLAFTLFTTLSGQTSAQAIASAGSLTSETGIDTVSSSTVSRLDAPRTVRLVAFTAERYGDTQVKVEWMTASEVNSDYFEVERSADARVWQVIGKVNAAGNSNSDINYAVTDAVPLSGTSYYRLRQADMDGNLTFSDMQSIYYTAVQQSATAMAIYANPRIGSEPVHIKLNSATDGISYILVVNAIGEKVYESYIADTPEYEIAAADLPTGTYTVNVQTASHQKYTGRLVSKD